MHRPTRRLPTDRYEKAFYLDLYRYIYEAVTNSAVIEEKIVERAIYI